MVIYCTDIWIWPGWLDRVTKMQIVVHQQISQNSFSILILLSSVLMFCLASNFILKFNKDMFRSSQHIIDIIAVKEAEESEW